MEVGRCKTDYGLKKRKCKSCPQVLMRLSQNCFQNTCSWVKKETTNKMEEATATFPANTVFVHSENAMDAMQWEGALLVPVGSRDLRHLLIWICIPCKAQQPHWMGWSTIWQHRSNKKGINRGASAWNKAIASARKWLVVKMLRLASLNKGISSALFDVGIIELPSRPESLPPVGLDSTPYIVAFNFR